MRKFFERIDDKIISEGVKELMIEEQSVYKVIAKSISEVLSDENISSLEKNLRTMPLSKLVDMMENKGFYVVMDNGHVVIELKKKEHVYDGMSRKDIAYYFMDCVDELK